MKQTSPNRGDMIAPRGPVYIRDYNSEFSDRTGRTSLLQNEVLIVLHVQYRPPIGDPQELFQRKVCEVKLLTGDGENVKFSCMAGNFSPFFRTLLSREET